jgi:hypothetical protein
MAFFDFLKPKKLDLDSRLSEIRIKLFPNGQKDLDKVTDELLFILDNKITREVAENIALKSVAISRIVKVFTIKRLKQHYSGYCLAYFTDKQIEEFHGYLAFLAFASNLYGKSPSQLEKKGEAWVLPR